MTVAEFLGLELDREAGLLAYTAYLKENAPEPLLIQGIGYHTLGKHPIPEELYGFGPLGRVTVFLCDVQDIRPMTFEEFVQHFGVFR